MKKIDNPSFQSFDFTQSGMLSDMSDNQFPTRMYAWNLQAFEPNYVQGTYFGYVHSDTAQLKLKNREGSYFLEKGMYFAVSEPFIIVGGKGILVERIGHFAPFTLGGPIEEEGRLKYIDGCTDSLLIPPVKLGDPCFNHLHFPKNIKQTPHTHPSIRVGLVAKGSGICVTPWGEIELKDGMLFIIKENNDPELRTLDFAVEYGEPITAVPGTHSFFTFDSDMDVIAYHPDSDFGPQDENHPMVNRTIVEGVSASKIDDIRTK